MAKAPVVITAPKVKKLAQKASKPPSMLTTEETRDLGASVVVFLSPPKDAPPTVVKEMPAKQSAGKRS